jgi:hypothetical protein
MMDEHTKELICRVVDGLATAEQERELNMRAEQEPELARELDEQRSATAHCMSVGQREAMDDLDDAFWGRVSNRIQYRAGWGFVILGSVLLTGYALYELMTDPGVDLVFRVSIGALVVGFGLLFLSVLRHRLRVRSHDRYTEVVR